MHLQGALIPPCSDADIALWSSCLDLKQSISSHTLVTPIHWNSGFCSTDFDFNQINFKVLWFFVSIHVNKKYYSHFQILKKTWP